MRNANIIWCLLAGRKTFEFEDGNLKIIKIPECLKNFKLTIEEGREVWDKYSDAELNEELIEWAVKRHNDSSYEIYCAANAILVLFKNKNCSWWTEQDNIDLEEKVVARYIYASQDPYFKSKSHEESINILNKFFNIDYGNLYNKHIPYL